jgi:hypothetical protein
MWIDSQGRVFTAHADIRQAWPQVSLPAVITDEALTDLGLRPVQRTPAPDVDHTQNVSEAPPTQDGGVWTQQWLVTPASAQEIQERTTTQAAAVRVQRNELLATCDWTQLPDAAVDAAAWAAYRQALRTVPAQVGFPWSVTWPAKP